VYEAHFGLSRHPFGETVSPSAYVAVPSRDAVLRRLRYGLEHGRGPALVFGPSGSGKTLLAGMLAREMGGTAVHLTFPALAAADLLAVLAEELGATPPGSQETVPGLLRRVRQVLAAAVARGERPLLIVDEAHLIEDPATFEALRLLLNFTSAGPSDLSLLLVGGPEVLLRLPHGLADRLSARCLLGPFTGDESATYLAGRLAAAGATTPLFTPETIAGLHRAADGLPRRLNRLADLALLVSYAEGLPRPDTRAVAIAAREWDPDGVAA
jgi:type II secretory pathway predicted ATPase ExeA